MMQHFRLRNAVGRPASVASRAAQSRWKKDMCSATTVVAPPPLSNDANTKTEQGVRCDTPRRRAEWRPSEAHKASATSLRRNEVAQAKVKAAPQVSAGGGLDSTSPGLRRRELLGVGGDASTQELASVSGASRREAGGSPVPGPGLSALLNTASGERSIASLSATQKYREQRELERLAASGSAEAVEVIRSPGSAHLSSAAASSAPDEGSADGAFSEHPPSGAGLTPLTVLPVLLVLVAAGYCAASDILPREWLSWFGGGGEGGAGAASSVKRDSSTAARSERCRGEYGEDEAGDMAGEGRARVQGHGDVDARCEISNQTWQQQQQQPSSTPSSPVLRTLSRAAVTAGPTSTPASVLVASAELPDPADPSAEAWHSRHVESVEHLVTRDYSREASGNAGGVSRWWGGGGPRNTSPPGRGGAGEAEVSSAGVGPRGLEQRGHTKERAESSGEKVGQQPLWLQRQRTPAPTRSS